MPTIAGLRRRGYTPEALRLMCERAGTSKAGGWTEYASLDAALRDDLDPKAPRAMAVLDPVELRLTNWAALFGSEAHREACHAPVHPQKPELGERRFALGPRLWIERDDFAEVPAKGFFRLYPGNRVRLKYGYVIECSGCEKDASGRVTAVLASVVPDTKSGTPGADAVKVKGAITWVGADDCAPAEVRIYDRLFTEAQPTPAARTSRRASTPRACASSPAMSRPDSRTPPPSSVSRSSATATSSPERHDHAPGRPVLNRIAPLRETWTSK
jgi:glutaminyl-tRNA synthetase